MKPKWNHGLMAMLVVSMVFAFHFYVQSENRNKAIYEILFWIDKPQLNELQKTFNYDKQSTEYKAVNWEINLRK